MSINNQTTTTPPQVALYNDLSNSNQILVIAPLAHHSENLERLVVYQKLNGAKKMSVYMPLDAFNELITVKGVDAAPCPRFQFVRETTFTPSYTGKDVAPGARYAHYSGKQYTVLDVAHDANVRTPYVIYRAEYTDKEFGAYAVWVRPLTMFIEMINKDGTMIPRFKKIDTL